MKRLKLLLAVAVPALLLCACTNEPDIPLSIPEVSVSDVEPSVEVSVSETSVDEPDPAADPEPAAVQKAPSAFKAIRMYADYLDELTKDNEALQSNLRYDILYVDDDDIPELVYMEDSSHSAMVHMCLAYEDGVFEVGEFGEYGNFAYVPRSGKILSFYMNHGTYLFDFFKLENRTLQEDKSYETVEPQFDDEDTRYYIDGDEVTQEEYDADYAKQRANSYESCEYYDAFSYNDSYDVYSILMEYHKNGHRPPTIEITDDIKNAEGEYAAVTYGVYGAEAVPIENFKTRYASASLTEDGYLSVWFGEDDEHFATDYAMPLSAYRDGLGTVSEGSKWYVKSQNETKDRDYEFHYISEDTVRLIVFDATGVFGDRSYYFDMQKVIHDDEGED